MASGVLNENRVKNFSTNEQVIGTWIDGKTLYGRFIDCGAIPSGAVDSYVMYTITNFDHIHLGYALTDTVSPLPYLNPTNMNASFGLLVSNTNGNVYIYTNQDRSSFGHLYVYVEYTKP